MPLRGLYYLEYVNLVSIDYWRYFSITFGIEEGGKRYVSGDKQDRERAGSLPEKESQAAWICCLINPRIRDRHEKSRFGRMVSRIVYRPK